MGVDNFLRDLLFGERRKCAMQIANDRRLGKRISVKASENMVQDALERLTHTVEQAAERLKK